MRLKQKEKSILGIREMSNLTNIKFANERYTPFD